MGASTDNNDNDSEDVNFVNMIADRLNTIYPPERKTLFKLKLQACVIESFSSTTATTATTTTTSTTTRGKRVSIIDEKEPNTETEATQQHQLRHYHQNYINTEPRRVTTQNEVQNIEDLSDISDYYNGRSRKILTKAIERERE